MTLRNSKALALVAAITSSSFLCAQDADTKPAPAAESTTPGVRYMIKSTSEVTSDRRMLINGEERGGGGGRGGAGGEPSPVVTKATLVYDEGTQTGGTWRKYHTAEAMVERAGRDGESVENKVASALAGKQIFVDRSGEQPKLFENDAKGGELDAAMTRDVPLATDLGALVPTGSIEAGTEFAVDAKFAGAFASLMHPVRPERAAGGRAGGNARDGAGAGEEGGARRRRGDGADGDSGGAGAGAGSERRGEGAGEGAGAGRGQGGNRAPGGMRGAMGADDSALRLLANQKLEWKGSAKITAVDSAANVAHVEFTADVTGAGTPDELGLNPMAQMGRMFGGGRGGAGGDAGAPPADAPAAQGEASAQLAVSGKYTIDLRTRRVASLTVSGTIESKSQVAMVREMRGEEVEIETDTETTGTFSIEVSCADAPAAAPAAGK